MNTEVFLKSVFSDKDEIKSLGGRWNQQQKLWYVPHGTKLEPFASKWDLYIKTNFSDKDEVKANGGRWDSEKKLWYIRAGQDLNLFKKWLPLSDSKESPEKQKESVRQSQDRRESYDSIHQNQNTPPTIQISINNIHSHSSASNSSPFKPNPPRSRPSVETVYLPSDSGSSIRASNLLDQTCELSSTELKDLLKTRNVKGHSQTPKADLIQLCLSLQLLRPVILPIGTPTSLAMTSSAEPSLPQLKELIKTHNIKGCSQMCKSELIEKCFCYKLLTKILVPNTTMKLQSSTSSSASSEHHTIREKSPLLANTSSMPAYMSSTPPQTSTAHTSAPKKRSSATAGVDFNSEYCSPSVYTSSNATYKAPRLAPANDHSTRKPTLEPSHERSLSTTSSAVPADYECPILCEIMRDPVICSDGFSYERSAISDWLKIRNTSPKTNEILPNTTLIPNKILKNMITEWIANNGEM